MQKVSIDRFVRFYSETLATNVTPLYFHPYYLIYSMFVVCSDGLSKAGIGVWYLDRGLHAADRRTVAETVVEAKVRSLQHVCLYGRAL